MDKINDIMVILKNYKKIIELTGGVVNQEFDIFIDILKPYKALNLETFKRKLDGDEVKNKRVKVSPREYSIQLGTLYYRLKTIGGLTEEEQKSLLTYLALSENQVINTILNSPFDEIYKIINELPDKSLTVNHLAFLGMALLNIRLKSGSKSVQKKNLLDVLWKVIENQKMNEIYESRL